MTSKMPPHLSLFGLPEEEQRIASHLLTLLSKLEQHITQFGAAVELFDYASRQIQQLVEECNRTKIPERFVLRQAIMSNPIIHWSHIAGRDAAMTINHFRLVLDAIT